MENLAELSQDFVEYAPIILIILTFICKNKIFTTPSQLSEKIMEERKEIMKEVEDRFLSLVAFREFEKRVDNNFKGLNHQLEKVDLSLEKIKDILIEKWGIYFE